MPSGPWSLAICRPAQAARGAGRSAAARVWPGSGPAQSGRRNAVRDPRQVPSPLCASAPPPSREAAQTGALLAWTQSPALSRPATFSVERRAWAPGSLGAPARLPAQPRTRAPAASALARARGPAATKPGSRAEGGGASREAGGVGGAECLADECGLLVHYKITKINGKQLSGFKSK